MLNNNHNILFTSVILLYFISNLYLYFFYSYAFTYVYFLVITILVTAFIIVYFLFKSELQMQLLIVIIFMTYVFDFVLSFWYLFGDGFILFYNCAYLLLMTFVLVELVLSIFF